MWRDLDKLKNENNGLQTIIFQASLFGFGNVSYIPLDETAIPITHFRTSQNKGTKLFPYNKMDFANAAILYPVITGSK